MQPSTYPKNYSKNGRSAILSAAWKRKLFFLICFPRKKSARWMSVSAPKWTQPSPGPIPAHFRIPQPCWTVCMSETTYVEAIRQGLWEELERDDSVFLLGEDIGA